MLTKKSIFGENGIENIKYQIYEIENNGKSEIGPFLQWLKETRLALYNKIMSALKNSALHGPPKNMEKFRSEGEGIFAFKAGQVRIYCFFDEEKIILLTHGAIKKQDRARPQDLEKAKSMHREWMAAKGKK